MYAKSLNNDARKLLAYLKKGDIVKMELDENNEPISERFYSERGLTEFVNYLEGSREKLIPNPIYMEGKKENVPVQVALS